MGQSFLCQRQESKGSILQKLLTEPPPPQVSGSMLTGQCAAFLGPLMKMPCNLITGSCSFIIQFSLHQSKLRTD